MCDSGGGGQSAAADRLYDAQAKISLEQFADWKKYFQPLEASVIKDVNELNDPARVEKRVATAQQDVSSQFSAARAQHQRQLESMGVNPSDGGFGASSRAFGLAEAGQRAGVANQARDQSLVESLQARMGLAQTGRGIANSAQQGLSNAAGGFAGLASQRQAQANSNNAQTGQALGLAASVAFMAGF